METQQYLTGPEDPDNYRVSVGRYSERWYTDPLPGCDIAGESDAVYPSISRVKKAAGSDWSYVTMRRISRATANDFRTLADRDPDQRLDGLKAITSHGLRIDAGRGTIVHWWGEDMLNGRPPRVVDKTLLFEHGIPEAALEIAERYKPALFDFFDAYQPELVATEFVVIDRELNGVGYGGTPDGIWRLNGVKKGVFAFDYKTRGPSSNHAAYPEEAAQVAAGVTAQYMIVTGDDGDAVRAPIPNVDGGMIVSIKPDGARVYPIDIEKAAEDWRTRHAWFVSRMTERDAIGRQWPVKRGTPKGAAA